MGCTFHPEVRLGSVSGPGLTFFFRKKKTRGYVSLAQLIDIGTNVRYFIKKKHLVCSLNISTNVSIHSFVINKCTKYSVGSNNICMNSICIFAIIDPNYVNASVAHTPYW